MKRTAVTLLAVLALLAAASFAAPNPPKPQPAAPHAAVTPTPQAGPHPAIQAAIRHLDQAREALEKAEHDFGGHRVKALDHVKKALEECHKALEFKE
jgi:uncharacterized protein involved in copper resistance